MTNTKAPQDVRIGFLTHDVSRMRRTLFDQAMRPLGITRSQWWVLSQLSRHARDGMLQTRIARDLDIGKVTVSGLIDRLGAAGSVVRRPDLVDRRAKRILITERALETMKDNIRRSIDEGDEADLPVGIFPADDGPEEAWRTASRAFRRTPAWPAPPP